MGWRRNYRKLYGRFYLMRERFAWGRFRHTRGDTTYMVIPAKFKPWVKRVKAFVTIVSLFSAYFIFDSVHYAFLFGILMWTVSGLLERFLFAHEILHMHPLPEFKWDGDKWLGQAFGYYEGEGGPIPLTRMIFNDGEYAKKVHGLLLSWSDGELDDKRGLISASIVMDGEVYYFRIYLSISKDTELKKELYAAGFHESNPDMVLRETHASLIICKQFKVLPDQSTLPVFVSMYREDDIPLLLEILIASPSDLNVANRIEGCPPMIIHKFKIRKKDQLTSKDLEYKMSKILGH